MHISNPIPSQTLQRIQRMRPQTNLLFVLGLFAALMTATTSSGQVTVRTRVTGAANWNVAATWIKTLTGAIDITAGNTVVTGVGTAFNTEIVAGDVIMLASTPGTTYVVGAVQTATQLTVQVAPVVSASGAAFGVQAVPGAFDNVEIGNSALTTAAVAVTLNQTTTVGSVTFIASPQANTLTHAAAYVLTVSGNVTLNQPTAVMTTAWNINAGSALVAGNVTLTGSSVTTGRISRIALTTGTLDIGVNLTYNLFTGSAATLGVVDLSGGASNLRIGGSLLLSGAATGTLNPGASSTVTYDGAGAQTVGDGSSIAYCHLTIDKAAGIATLGAACSATGNVLISAGTLSCAALSLATGGNLTNSGTLVTTTGGISVAGNWTNNGTFTFGTGTVTFNGTANQVIGGAASQAFYNITVNKTAGTLSTSGVTSLTARAYTQTNGNFIAPATLDLSSSLTITTDTLTAGASLLVAGNWANNGVFIHNSGTVTFNGSAQTLSGTSTTSFRNLTLSTATTLTANTNFNVASNLDLSNASATLVPAATVVINSAAPAGTITGAGTIRVSRITDPASYNGQYKFTTSTLTNLRVEYTGAGAQDVTVLPYSRLSIAGTGTKTAAGALAVSGTLLIATTATLDMATYDLTGAFATSTAGFLKTQATSALPVPAGKSWAFSVEFNSASGGQTVPQGTYARLTNSNTSGVNTASGALSVSTALTLNAGSVLNMGVNALSGAITTVAGTGTLRTQNTTTTPISLNKVWTGPVIFDNATGGQTVVAGTYSTLSAAHTSGTTSVGGSITVTGAFSSLAAGGAFNAAAFTVTVGGDWMLAGALTSTGTFAFNGAATQTVSAGGAFQNLTVNKAGGNLVLGSNVTVGGALTFTLGKISTGSYTLSSTSGTINGAGQSTGWVAGKLQLPFSSATLTRTFSIGGSQYYSPLTLTFAAVSVAGGITASTPDGAHPSIQGSNILTAKNIPRYWSIENSGGAVFTTYTAALTWNVAENYVGITPASLVTGLYASSAWTQPTVSGTPTATTITTTSIATPGDLIVGEPCAVSATINYTASPYCGSAGIATVTLTGTTGGTFSSAAGLSLNASTGAVDLAASTAGTYTVTYGFAASGGCAAFSTTASITVTEAPYATGSYPGNPYCTNGGFAYPSGSTSGGGTLTASPAGLSLNSSNGLVNLGASAPGTYTVTLTIPASGGCPVFTSSSSITINAAPSATILYAGSPYCTNSGTAAATLSGTTGGTFTSTTGLSINASTGGVDIAASTPGTYTVTYSIGAANGCVAFSTTASIQISSIANNDIDYTNGTSGVVCSSVGEGGTATLTAPAGTQFVKVGFASYGTPAGACSTFVINNACHAATSQTVAQSYLLGNNTGSIVANNTVFTDPCMGIPKTFSVQASYAQPICAGSTASTIIGTTPIGGNGTYTYAWQSSTTSAVSGFAAAPGTANAIDYTPGAVSQTTWLRRVVTSGGCSSTSLVVLVKVTPTNTASISYTGSPYCSSSGTATVTQTGATGGTYSGTTGLVINATTGAVTLGSSTAGAHTVTYTIAASGGCSAFSATSGITITAQPYATGAYPASPYCTNGGTASPVGGTNASGTFSFTPAGLSIDQYSGTVNLGLSLPGIYIVNYTVAAAGGCPQYVFPTGITINAGPTAAISYAGSPYCSASGTTTVTQTGTTGGSFSSTAGLSLNASTGEVNLATSTVGNYTVTYSVAAAGGCAAYSTTTNISIGVSPTSVSGVATSTCLGGSIGTITASASGGTSPYTYSLNAGAYQSQTTFSFLAAGTYTLNAKGPTGCVTSASVVVSPFGNSAGNQNTAGTNSWIGHVYDGMAFNDYIGYYTETDTFNQTFGGHPQCFSLTSGAQTSAIYTETFSVKYRMNSTRKGLFVVDLGSDDGSRLTVDGTLVYDSWVNQSFFVRPSVLMSLNGASSLLYEYFENAGSNRVAFQNLTSIAENTLSTNTTQSICAGASGSAISGDVYGVLPTGITASGTGYQWTYSTTPGGVKTNIAGATAATLIPSTAIAPFNAAGTYYVYRNIVLSSANNVSPNPYVATNESNAATITIIAAPTATISYTGTPYCQNGGTASVTRTGTAGGTYSSTAGLSISPSTGAITLGSSTPGTYTVTYTVAASGSCAQFQTTASVSVTATPSAAISYAGGPFCQNGGTANVTQTGTAGGTYSSTTGLTINSTTGTITLGTSTAGTYTVTYTVAAANGCAQYQTAASVTVTATPSATISYSGSPFCQTAGIASVTQTGSSGGTYSSTAGLTINSSTGAITPGTSTAGTYTVTYTVAAANGCAQYQVTTSATVTATPTATISYTASPYCQSGGTASATRIGTAGGTYSSTTGLAINATTGAITLGTSTPGNYTVTYTVAAANGCAQIQATASVTVTATPSATISYTGTPFCQSTGTASVTRTGTAGGTYSSTAGLIIDASTGAITLGSSTVGTYTVTYTVAASAGCAQFQTTASVTVTTTPSATIGYTSTPYCQNGGTASVALTGTAGGTYTSTAGLSINSSTGAITLATSTPGTYTVTYTVAASGGCAQFQTTASVAVTATPSAAISYVGSPYCVGTASVTQTGTAGGTYTATAGLSINAVTGAVNVAASTPGAYTVTYTVAVTNGCLAFSTTATIQIYSIVNNDIDYTHGTSGTLCATPGEGSTAVLTAPAGTHFVKVGFASYGNPTGACSTFVLGSCHAATSQTVAQTYLLGNNSGSIPATNAVFTDPCNGTPKRFYVQASYAEPICAGTTPGTIVGTTPTGGNGTYVYAWESSTTNATAGFSAAAGTNNGKDYAPGALSQTTWFRRAVTSGGCSSTSVVVRIHITPQPSASISYTGGPYCTSGSNAAVTQSGTPSGTYSSTAGLSINSTTGAVNTAASTAGTYTVTYTVPASAGCGQYTTTTSISINTAPAATIAYTGSPYCTSGGTVSVTQTGTAGGTYSSTAGLSVNATTGAITPGTSNSGTYTVTYTVPAANGCVSISATASVTISSAPSAAISYAGTPYCSSSGTATVIQTGVTGGTYSGTAGLAVNSGTGAVTLGISTAGTHTVTYTVAAANGCPAFSTTASIVVTAQPAATGGYANPAYCTNGGFAIPYGSSNATGTLSASPSGIFVDANFTNYGVINLGASMPGVYTITYTVPAGGGCAQYTNSWPITIGAAPTSSISYAGSPYCSGAGTATVTQTGTTGGSFTSAAGLSINASTGAIDLGASTPGTHTVTYTVAAANGCAQVTAATSVTITTAPSATISYSGSPFCSSSGTANVMLTGTTGGTFSGTSGLVIDVNTGVVTLGTSAPGTHTITYSVAAANGCAAFSTTANIAITPQPFVSGGYVGSPYCTNGGSISPAGTTNAVGTFSATPVGIYTDANFINYGVINLGVSSPGAYTVIYTVPAGGGCAQYTTSNSITINAAPTGTIAYSGSPYCAGAGTAAVTQTGTTGGTFSSIAGLSLNATTGAINLGASTPGSYTVTYSVAAAGGCASFSTTANTTVTAVPSATIAYAGTSYCANGGTAAVTQTGSSGGTYSSTAGLSINTTTGAISLGSSTPGTYTVTYTVAAAGGCAQYTTTTSVVVTPTPNAIISYAGSPYCSNGGTVSVTQTGTTGGTYSSAAGLSINTTTGAINLGASTPGTYTVTYSVAAAGGCSSFSATTGVTITTAPSAAISYAGSPYCSNGGSATVTQTGATGGTYSSTTGLSINATTGAVNLGASTAGTYTVTYIVAAANGCAQYTTTASVTVTASPSATILYAGLPYCTTGGTATVTKTGTNGGTYSSTTGLSINSTSGAITLASSTPGTYIVTYTVAAANGCASFSTTTSVTVTAAPSATIAYTGTPYCTNGGTASVTRTGTAGGTYSSTTGLSINATTGAVTLASSTAGTYTVTYTVAASGGCALYTTTTSVTITAAPSATISYTGSPYCSTGGTASVTRTGTAGGNYSSTTGLSINSTSGAITLSSSTAGTYTVTYTVAAANGCAAFSTTASVTVTAAPSATITYTGSPYCGACGTASVTHTGTAGGTYTASPAGLSINSSTGAITLASSTPGTYTVTYTVAASGGCAAFTTTASVVIHNNYTWTGATSTAWTTAGNWSPAAVPLATASVTIPSAVPNYPLISSGTVSIKDVAIISPAAVTISGAGIFRVAGAITGTGKLTASAGTVELNGTAAQTLAGTAFTGGVVKNLTANNSAGVTLTSALGASGIVKATTGNLASGGHLTLLSSSAGTALIDGSGAGNVTGAVHMQRYLPTGFGYKYLSSPFSNATVAELADDINLSESFPTLYYNNENLTSAGWTADTAAALGLVVGRGYAANFGLLSAPDTFDLTGTVNNGPVSFLNLYNHNHPYTQGFNLVGNPYPSPIDWNSVSGWSKTAMDNAVYFFNAGTTDRYTGSYSSYINGVSSNGVATNIIAAMQGFFVHVSNGSYPVAASMTVNNAARVNNLTAHYHKTTGNDLPLVRLGVSYDDISAERDDAVVYFEPAARTAFDAGLDALKLLNTDVRVPNLYSQSADGEKLSIAAMPAPGDSIRYVPLGIEVSKAGPVMMKAVTLENLPMDLNVFLADRLTGIAQNVRTQPEYRAQLDSGVHNARFFLVFTTEASVNLPRGNEELLAYTHGSDLYVFTTTGGDLTLTNTLGQVILRQSFIGTGFHRIPVQAATGMYIATLTSATQRQAKKVFIGEGR